MTADLTAQVVRVAGAVRDRFARMDAPANPDDVFQDAALAMLEAVRNGKLDLGQNVAGYFWTVGSRQAGVAASKMLSKVSIPPKKAHLARRFQNGLPIQGAGATPEDEEAGRAVYLVAEGRASDGVFEEAGQRQLCSLRIRQARLLERHAWDLEDLDRRIVTAALGLGGEPPVEGGLPQVAFCLGVTEQRCRNAVERLGVAARADVELRRLRRNMSQEDAP